MYKRLLFSLGLVYNQTQRNYVLVNMTLIRKVGPPLFKWWSWKTTTNNIFLLSQNNSVESRFARIKTNSREFSPLDLGLQAFWFLLFTSQKKVWTTFLFSVCTSRKEWKRFFFTLHLVEAKACFLRTRKVFVRNPWNCTRKFLDWMVWKVYGRSGKFPFPFWEYLTE